MPVTPASTSHQPAAGTTLSTSDRNVAVDASRDDFASHTVVSSPVSSQCRHRCFADPPAASSGRTAAISAATSLYGTCIHARNASSGDVSFGATPETGSRSFQTTYDRFTSHELSATPAPASVRWAIKLLSASWQDSADGLFDEVAGAWSSQSV